MRSAKLATNFQDTLDLRYGRHPRETLDYFSCGKRNAPLFVFIHGGYWQMRNKEMFRFVATGPLAHGFDVANIGYPLAPDRDMRGIIASLRSAFSYLRLHNDELGFDATHIFVSGWSAGAHLAVNMLDERGVCGALAISGIYDLEPISKCYLNDKLQLTESEPTSFRNFAGSASNLRCAVRETEFPVRSTCFRIRTILRFLRNSKIRKDR
jgi:arylformamidase